MRKREREREREGGSYQDKNISNANLNVKDNTVTCDLHWPSNFD